MPIVGGGHRGQINSYTATCKINKHALHYATGIALFIKLLVSATFANMQRNQQGFVAVIANLSLFNVQLEQVGNLLTLHSLEEVKKNTLN